MSKIERDEFGRVRKEEKGGHHSGISSRDRRPPSDRHDHNNSYSSSGKNCHYGPAHERQEEEVLHPGLVIKGEVIRIESYGAFVDFKDKLQHRNKGLCHISQMASYRVENVTDVLKMNQQVYAVILEVEYDQRSGKRIRLSLKDVDQNSGRYTGRD
ncbi:MAG: hypothetical protein SGILL_001024, partial [Bacillariaceae sp.]